MKFAACKRPQFFLERNKSWPLFTLRIRTFTFLMFHLFFLLLLGFDHHSGSGIVLAASTTVSSTPSVSPTPTVDRLAEPTLPPDPGQADLGAQAYWLRCMACHGDRGQGLTDEFRMLYPEEDRNCWNSGCHGAKTYENGFILPTSVPKIIDPQALDKFETAAGLYGFIRAAMPFQNPGSLKDHEYWQLTSFLLRENEIVDLNEPLGPDNAPQVRLKPESTGVVMESTTAAPSGNQNEVLPTDISPHIQTEEGESFYLVPLIGVGLLLVVVLVLYRRTRK